LLRFYCVSRSRHSPETPQSEGILRRAASMFSPTIEQARTKPKGTTTRQRGIQTPTPARRARRMRSISLLIFSLFACTAGAWSAKVIIVNDGKKNTQTFKYVTQATKANMENTHHLSVEGAFACDAVLFHGPTPWDEPSGLSPNFVGFYCSEKEKPAVTFSVMNPCPAGGGLLLPVHKKKIITISAICD
jgi:hypothetical protein